MDTATIESTTLGDAEPDRYTAIPASVSTPGESPGDATRGSRWDVEGTIGRARTDVYDTAVRLRAQIGPHAAAGATVGAGFALEAITAAGGVTPFSAALMAAAASAAAVGALFARARRRGSEWAQRLLVAGAGAGLWLTTAPYGVGIGDVAVLTAAEFALAARWWQANRPGYPGTAFTVLEDETAYFMPEPEPLAPVEQILADWDEYVACDNGPLRKARLIAPEEHQYGFSFTLQLWRGQQTFATAMAALGKIASGLHVGVNQLVLDEVPAPPGPDGESRPPRCRLQVITRSPIAGAVDFDGPRRRGGILELGPYADGSGDAPYRLYTPGSMWSGVIIGGTGIGKSRVVENIVISALSGGDTEFWFIDPSRGSSSPALAEHANWFATAEESLAVLEAAIAILNARTDENSVEGWTGFSPSAARPGLLIVVEECHNVFTPETAKRWARIAREGRKVGIALLCVSQKSSVDTFGNEDAIRSSVMEGNALVLRSTSNQTGPMMAGLQIDPKTLPKIRGYAYVQGSEEGGVRTAPFRNRNTEPDDGPGAAFWLAQQPRPGLDTLAVTSTLTVGTAYRDRHVSSDTGRAGSRARVDALRNGHVPADMLQGAEEEAVVPLAGIVQFPEFRLVEQAPIETAAGSNSAGLLVEGLTSSQQAVLDAVAAGIDRPRLLEAHIGLKHRQIQNILRALLDAGLITNPEYGRYQRAA